MNKWLALKTLIATIMIISAFVIGQVGNVTPSITFTNINATDIFTPFSQVSTSIVTGFGAAVGALLLKLLVDYLGNRDWRKKHGENHTPVVTYP